VDEDKAGSGVDADFVLGRMLVGAPEGSSVDVEFLVVQHTLAGALESLSVDIVCLLLRTLVQA